MDFSDFEPVSKAEAVAAEASPAAETASGAPSAPVTPSAAVLEAPRPQALFAPGRDRSRRFDLSWPILFGGRTYGVVVVRRPSSKEVGEFYEQLIETTRRDPAAELKLPVFVDEDGKPIPAEVLDMLDDDDDQPITAAVRDFLPRRLLLLVGGDPSSSA